MIRDRYGLSLSTSSAPAAQAYVEGVDRFLGAHVAPDECFDHAVAADPGFALGHIGRARSLQLLGRGALAQAAAARARELGASLDRRERQHVEALGLAVAGQGARALALIREHVAEFPRDVMALAAANGIYGLIGFSGRQDRNEAMLALLESVAPAYGEDWWFLGAHGFARTEALGWKAGEPLIERALTLAPRNAHAAHAWAHVCYEKGDDQAGAQFVAGFLPEYPKAASLHCHLSWHRALFELGAGPSRRRARALRGRHQAGGVAVRAVLDPGGLRLVPVAPRAGGRAARGGGVERGRPARACVVSRHRHLLRGRALRGGAGRARAMPRAWRAG